MPGTWGEWSAALGIIVIVMSALLYLIRIEIKAVKAELRPNHGGSLRDAVDGAIARIEDLRHDHHDLSARVNSLRSSNDATHDRLAAILEAHIADPAHDRRRTDRP